MTAIDRRAFLSDLGSGMLAVGLGASLTRDLGLTLAFAERDDAVPLGQYTRLVELMRSTPAEELQPLLVAQLQQGEVDLEQLVAAGALANAVTFGGSDYVGFHVAMALLPALTMSAHLPEARRSLPVLKVLYRNAERMQEVGGAHTTALYARTVAATDASATGEDLGERIRRACREVDIERGEDLLAGVADAPLEAFNALQPAMQDDVNVHRFVFAHRTHGLVGLVGEEHAHTLLRQCVRHCISYEENRIERGWSEPALRALVPKLLDRYELLGTQLGERDPGDTAVDELGRTIYAGPSDQAAEAVAAALAEGVAPEVVGEAISLASNLCVLRQGPDVWRAHGDAVGVHSSDATNAWRNMARIAEPRHAVAGLIVAGYYACSGGGSGKPAFGSPGYPTNEHRALVETTDPARLLVEAEDAVRHNDQGRATAAIQIYGEQGHAVQPVFDLLLRYAVSEDGRLHAEKYYQTVSEEYRTTRVAFRWRQLVALARVTASAYGCDRKDRRGFRAAGYEDACRLLGVEA